VRSKDGSLPFRAFEGVQPENALCVRCSGRSASYSRHGFDLFPSHFIALFARPSEWGDR